MIFTLNAYRDLGRCSYGTLKETFDTEKDKIIFKGKQVEINKIEDLFPFLWQSPGCAYHDNVEHKSVSSFYSEGTHWHHDFDDSIVRNDKEIAKLEKKIAKNPDSHLVKKWTRDLEFCKEHNGSLKRMLKRLDEELEEQKLALIEENKGK